MVQSASSKCKPYTDQLMFETNERINKQKWKENEKKSDQHLAEK